jgi:hypothetical protein
VILEDIETSDPIRLIRDTQIRREKIRKYRKTNGDKEILKVIKKR